FRLIRFRRSSFPPESVIVPIDVMPDMVEDIRYGPCDKDESAAQLLRVKELKLLARGFVGFADRPKISQANWFDPFRSFDFDVQRAAMRSQRRFEIRKAFEIGLRRHNRGIEAPAGFLRARHH